MPDGDVNDLVKDASQEKQAKWLIGLQLLLALIVLGSAAVLAIREYPPSSSPRSSRSLPVPAAFYISSG